MPKGCSFFVRFLVAFILAFAATQAVSAYVLPILVAGIAIRGGVLLFYTPATLQLYLCGKRCGKRGR